MTTPDISKVQITETFAPKLPKGTLGQEVTIKTNAVPLKLTPNIPFYRYDLRIAVVFPGKDGQDHIKEITKQTRNDYPEAVRADKSRAILDYLIKKETKFFPQRSLLSTDDAAILWSLKKLAIPQGEPKLFTFDAKEVPAANIDDVAARIEIRIKPVDEQFQVTSNDIQKYVTGDRTLLNFLNLLTSQQAATDDRFARYGSGRQFYVINPEAMGLEGEVPELKNGKTGGVGLEKSVRVCEGPGPNAAVRPLIFADTKKGAFHQEGMPLRDKIDQCIPGREPLERRIAIRKEQLMAQIRGLYVTRSYGQGKSFAIAGITGRPLKDEGFETQDGRHVSLVHYYKTQYQIILKDLNLPCVIGFKGNKFPIELLHVAPHQRVTQKQQTPEQIQQMTKSSATLPKKRQELTEKMLTATGLKEGTKNPMLEAAGVSVGKPVEVKGRVLPPASVVYGTGKKQQARKSWQMEKFLRGAEIPRWEAIGVIDGRDEDAFNEFVEEFQKQGRSLGILFGAPVATEIIARTTEALLERLEQAKARDTRFVLIVEGQGCDFHNTVKLAETRLQMITQCVRGQTVMAVLGRNGRQRAPLTMKNILAKTNLKNGGTNHHTEILSKMTWTVEDKKKRNGVRVIVGLDMSHPPPSKERDADEETRTPSVIGYAANYVDDPQNFAGDFRYVEPKTTKLIKAIGPIIKDVLAKTRKNRPTVDGKVGPPPTHIVIYRHGVSEGDFKTVAEQEFSELQAAFHELGQGKYKPDVTIIAVTTDHNQRLYNKEIIGTKAAEQNVPAGLVIDSGIVSPLYSEFLLTSHSAFQGTAKPPRYTVLKDTYGMSLDEIESMTHGLTFMHQIMAQTTSLPAVLQVSGEYAKRGLNNWLEYTRNGGEPITYSEANQLLTNQEKPLSNVRVNA